MILTISVIYDVLQTAEVVDNVSVAQFNIINLCTSAAEKILEVILCDPQIVGSIPGFKYYHNNTMMIFY